MVDIEQNKDFVTMRRLGGRIQREVKWAFGAAARTNIELVV
jgi:hypothetical protein